MKTEIGYLTKPSKALYWIRTRKEDRMTGEKTFRTRMKYLMRQKALAENRDITIGEIAEAVGFNRNTVARYANNQVKRPDMTLVYRLCDYFNVSMAEFVEGDEAKPEMRNRQQSGAPVMTR